MRLDAIVVTVVLGLCAQACSSKSGQQSGGDAAAGAGGGAAGGAGGGAPLSLPADWARPADCGGVGNLCSEGCSPAAECQLEGNICIPLAGPGGFPGYSAQTPYCLAFTCMNYDQASCFCTGSAAAMFPTCQDGPRAVGGQCAGRTAACLNGTCCAGLACVHDHPNSGVCLVPCTKNSDCDTGCCTDLKDTGDLECAPASACQNLCTKRGGACTDSGSCCNGTCIMGTTNPDFVGCRPSCSTNADCDTGCCQPFADGSFGFCTSSGYCGCGAGCAADSSCLTFDGQNFACYKNCTAGTQCSTGCCTSPIPGKNYGSCVACQ